MDPKITDSTLVALGGLIGVVALLFLLITLKRWHVFIALLGPILLFALIPGIDRAAPASHQQRSSGANPTVLYVGSIFNRRRVPDLIRGFAPIARAHPNASLDIVGDNRSYPRLDLYRTIHAEGMEAAVRWHEYVTEDQLTELYERGRAFAFLSEYEGLGLTPLEALAAGAPAVLLDTPVARESSERAIQ